MYDRQPLRLSWRALKQPSSSCINAHKLPPLPLPALDNVSCRMLSCGLPLWLFPFMHASLSLPLQGLTHAAWSCQLPPIWHSSCTPGGMALILQLQHTTRTYL